MLTSRFFLLLCGSLWAGAGAAAQTTSPFLPARQPAAAKVDADAPFAFVGVIPSGDRTLVCVTALPEQRSRWIAVGASADGIKVARYDAAAQEIVVEQGGRSYTLALKRASVRANPAGRAPASPTPAAGPLPVASVAAPVPVTDAEKESEARFPVSDLLEIGMIQRKAYEEAQRKAQENGATNTPPAATTNPVPATTPAPR